MIDRDDIMDEAMAIAESDEAVGAEAQEIVFDVMKNSLLVSLRSKKQEYEAKNNIISALTIDNLLRELNDV